MFRRRRDAEPTQAAPAVLPTEGRNFSYRYEQENDSDERTSRAEGRYLAESERGNDYNITELTMGRTVTMPRGESIGVGDINDAFGALATWLANQPSGVSSRIAKYLVEYPRHTVDAPIQAVVVAAQNGALRLYELREVGDTVLVVDRPDFDDDTVISAPKGARITTSIRGRELAGDTPFASEGESSYEERLMSEIHGAIVDYDREHPIR